jgi:thioredoxin 1
MSVRHVNDDGFESGVLNAEGPVLVDFWADWCSPCHQVAPLLDELAGDLAGKITIAKLNVDDNPATAARYGVSGIPTLMIFKGGEVAASKIGALPKSRLYEWVESNL